MSFSRTLALSVCVLLCMARPVWAEGDSLAESTAESSDDSSQGSDSNDSSNDSSQDFTDETTEEVSTGIVVVTVAMITTAGIILNVFANAMSGDGKGQLARLTAFFRQYHAFVVRDLALGHGPLLDEWISDLKLSKIEADSFRKRLNEPEERAALLAILSKPIDAQTVTAFSVRFGGLLIAGMPEARARQLVSGSPVAK